MSYPSYCTKKTRIDNSHYNKALYGKRLDKDLLLRSGTHQFGENVIVNTFIIYIYSS